MAIAFFIQIILRMNSVAILQKEEIIEKVTGWVFYAFLIIKCLLSIFLWWVKEDLIRILTNSIYSLERVPALSQPEINPHIRNSIRASVPPTCFPFCHEILVYKMLDSRQLTMVLNLLVLIRINRMTKRNLKQLLADLLGDEIRWQLAENRAH